MDQAQLDTELKRLEDQERSDQAWLEQAHPVDAATAVARKLLVTMGNLDAVVRSEARRDKSEAICLTVFLQTLAAAADYIPKIAESLDHSAGPFVHPRGSGATPHEAVLAMAEKLHHAICWTADCEAVVKAELDDRVPDVPVSNMLEQWDHVAEAVRKLPPLDTEPINAALLHTSRVSMKRQTDDDGAISREQAAFLLVTIKEKTLENKKFPQPMRYSQFIELAAKHYPKNQIPPTFAAACKALSHMPKKEKSRRKKLSS